MCPDIDLEDPYARYVVDMIFLLLAERGGSVDQQCDLLRPLHEMFGISHGTGQHYVDALGARGCLRIEYTGRKIRRKRITFLKEPELPPHGPVKTHDPGWPTRPSPLRGRDFPTVSGA